MKELFGFSCSDMLMSLSGKMNFLGGKQLALLTARDTVRKKVLRNVSSRVKILLESKNES